MFGMLEAAGTAVKRFVIRQCVVYFGYREGAVHGVEFPWRPHLGMFPPFDLLIRDLELIVERRIRVPFHPSSVIVFGEQVRVVTGRLHPDIA